MDSRREPVDPRACPSPRRPRKTPSGVLGRSGPSSGIPPGTGPGTQGLALAAGGRPGGGLAACRVWRACLERPRRERLRRKRISNRSSVPDDRVGDAVGLLHVTAEPGALVRPRFRYERTALDPETIISPLQPSPRTPPRAQARPKTSFLELFRQPRVTGASCCTLLRGQWRS